MSTIEEDVLQIPHRHLYASDTQSVPTRRVPRLAATAGDGIAGGDRHREAGRLQPALTLRGNGRNFCGGLIYRT